MSFAVKNELLFESNENGDWNQVEFFPTPNTGGNMNPEYIVIHFTAGSGDARATAAYFQRPEARVSAHLNISMNGEVTQNVPFDTVAWHAGKSRWDNHRNLNSNSIGIEVCNPGPLTITKSGYKAWFGKYYTSDDIIEAPHPNNPDGEVFGWLPFTEQQVQALISIGTELVKAKNIKECVGHDMISPGRKSDPGPTMNYRVYDLINGSCSDKAMDSVYQVKTSGSSLNGRSGPGTTYAVIHTLAPGDEVEVISRRGSWVFIETEDGKEVWCHSKFIIRA